MSLIRYNNPWNLLNTLQRELYPEASRLNDDDASVATASWAPSVDISEDDQLLSTVRGSVDGASRFGVLDAQPEAKLKAVLDISTSLAGTVDLQAMLPKILDTLFAVFPYADRG